MLKIICCAAVLYEFNFKLNLYFDFSMEFELVFLWLWRLHEDTKEMFDTNDQILSWHTNTSWHVIVISYDRTWHKLRCHNTYIKCQYWRKCYIYISSPSSHLKVMKLENPRLGDIRKVKEKEWIILERQEGIIPGQLGSDTDRETGHLALLSQISTHCPTPGRLVSTSHNMFLSPKSGLSAR